MIRKREDRERLGDVRLHPVGAARYFLSVIADRHLQKSVGLGPFGSVEHASDVAGDLLSFLQARHVMDRVPLEMNWHISGKELLLHFAILPVRA